MACARPRKLRHQSEALPLLPHLMVTTVGATQVVAPTERCVVEERRTVYCLGAVGAKGGEVHEEDDDDRPPKI